MSQLSITTAKATSGVRRSKAVATDAQMVHFLYMILKQLDLKSIDWSLVASQMEISNGHAARMRYSRFRQQMEGSLSLTRPTRPKKATSTKGDKCGGSRSTKIASSNHKHMEGSKKHHIAGEWSHLARKANPVSLRHGSLPPLNAISKFEIDPCSAYSSASATVGLPPGASTAPAISAFMASLASLSPCSYMDTSQASRSAVTSPFQFNSSPFATLCPEDPSVFQTSGTNRLQHPHPHQHPAPVVHFPSSASFTPSFAPAPQPSRVEYRWAPIKPEPGEAGSMDDLLIKVESGVAA